MKIIKLDAIDSTNSFLRDLANTTAVKNFTTVIAKTQLNGRGQRGNTWQSEDDKNLLFSTLIYHKHLKIHQQTYLNFAVSLAVFDVLNELAIPKVAIKWPNDILAENKKLCGILIENVIQNQNIESSIIGIGLNVNQQKFPTDLPNAASIIHFIGKGMDVENLLSSILTKFKFYISLLHQQKHSLLKEKYLAVLYKKDIPTTFIDAKNNYFMGMIKGVSDVGKLQIQLENDTIKEFDLKEVAFA